MACKFLIVDGLFIMSSAVEYHRELIPENGNANKIISGGGRFNISPETRRVLLYDKSDEFGAATKEMIIEALDSSFLPDELIGYEFYIFSCTWFSEALKQANSREPDWICV